MKRLIRCRVGRVCFISEGSRLLNGSSAVLRIHLGPASHQRREEQRGTMEGRPVERRRERLAEMEPEDAVSSVT